MRPVIIAFAKNPVPGRVKTRLTPPLSAEAAASLYTAFVLDTLDLLRGLADSVDIELHTDTETDAWTDAGVPCRIQYEGDLGLKMLNALAGALAAGRERAIIVGTDSPTLRPSHLETLLALDTDIALGPTEDGGFYAIAARKVHPAMFDGVRWSTASALEDTVRACERAGLTAGLGPRWFDVDSAADLERLQAGDMLPVHTARVLRLQGS